jgi:hypothetical protein
MNCALIPGCNKNGLASLAVRSTVPVYHRCFDSWCGHFGITYMWKRSLLDPRVIVSGDWCLMAWWLWWWWECDGTLSIKSSSSLTEIQIETDLSFTLQSARDNEFQPLYFIGIHNAIFLWCVGNACWRQIHSNSTYLINIITPWNGRWKQAWRKCMLFTIGTVRPRLLCTKNRSGK